MNLDSQDSATQTQTELKSIGTQHESDDLLYLIERLPDQKRKALLLDALKVSDVVHEGITCSACGEEIRGIRYSCPTFKCKKDFCQFCEATEEHAHPLLKLRAPQARIIDLPQMPATNLEIVSTKSAEQVSFHSA